MVCPETIRLSLTVDTIDSKDDTVRTVTVGVDINFQAYGRVELVERVAGEFLPCLQALAAAGLRLGTVVGKPIGEYDRVGCPMCRHGERRDNARRCRSTGRRPEEVLVFCVRRVEDRTVCGHDLEGGLFAYKRLAFRDHCRGDRYRRSVEGSGQRASRVR